MQQLLPLALPLGLILIGVVLTCFAGFRRRRPHPCCLRCRYDLSWIVGIATECPECGTSIRGGRFGGSSRRQVQRECARITGVVALSVGVLVLSMVAGSQLL